MENIVQKPSPGRVVHVNDTRYPKAKLAGIVTAAFDNNLVNVAAWSPTGVPITFFSIPHAGDTRHPLDPGIATWEWPTRV